VLALTAIDNLICCIDSGRYAKGKPSSGPGVKTGFGRSFWGLRGIEGGDAHADGLLRHLCFSGENRLS
jgi:hypothetical protein